MRYRSIIKKGLSFIAVLLLIGVIFLKAGVFDVIAATCNYYLEIRFQGRVKSTDQSDTENAVPQSMAGNGNTVYLYKTRKNLNEGEDDRGYIIKVLNANTNSPKLVLPADAVYVGHGNGMTYYNGYMYFADGEEAKLYRVREEENSTQAWDSSTEWTNGKGTAHYEKKTLSLSGLNSGETIRNIAHYTGDYFIVCLDKSYNESTKTNSLTYGVGILNNTTFTIKKRFYVNATDTYGTVQDIDYRDGYLWAVLYQNNSTNNHIHLIEIPTSYNSIENGKTYNVKKTISINKNEADRADTLNEIESVYVYGGNYYTWSNIREGWNETFCRYSCFPNGVNMSSVSTKSDTSIEIKWDKVSNVETYRIDRRIEGGEYTTIATVDSANNSYTDNGLTAGTKYYYRVYGVNSAGTSPKKDGVQGVTKTDTPKVTSVTALSDSELKITWTAVTGAKKYIVCRKKEGSGEGWEYYSRIKDTTGTEYLDTGLEQNTKYYYGIIAVNETGVESGGENGNPASQNRMDGTTLETIKISLNKTSLNLVVNEPYILTATITPAYAANNLVKWSSSDSSIVSINQSGTITALKPGTAVITATEQGKNKTATCAVTVAVADTLDFEEGQTLLNGSYLIQLAGTKQVLTICEHSDEDGANICLEQEPSSDYDLFRFEYVSNGYYTIKNVGSGKCLEDVSAVTAFGTKIQQKALELKAEQLWQPVKRNSMYYIVPQSESSLVLNMGDIDNNTLPYANLWIPKNEAHQLFELIPVVQEMNEADIMFPEDVTEIEEAAFEETDVKIVYISDNCKYIGEYAFRNSKVQQIRIPADCVLGEDVFDGCSDIIIFGTAGSAAQEYCVTHENCEFVEE